MLAKRARNITDDRQREKEIVVERFDDQLFREYVAEKTDAQRQGTRHVTDELNDEKKRRHPEDRPAKMLQVAEESLFSKALVVVIKEDAESRMRGRDVEIAGRREKSRDQAQEISDQDIERQRSDNRR